MVAFLLSPGRLSGPIMSLMNMNRGRLANEGLDALGKKMLPPKFPWRAEGGGGVGLTPGQQEVDIGGARAANEHGVFNPVSTTSVRAITPLQAPGAAVWVYLRLPAPRRRQVRFIYPQLCLRVCVCGV